MTTLFVGNLVEKVNEAHLKELFRECGEITSITMKNGFGFVEFASDRYIDETIKEFNRYNLFGKNIIVQRAHGKDEKKKSKEESSSGSRLYSPPSDSKYVVTIEGIDEYTDWKMVKDHFRNIADVCYTKVIPASDENEKPKAIVKFKTRDDMIKAERYLNHTKINGNVISIIIEENDDMSVGSYDSETRKRLISSLKKRKSLSRSRSRSRRKKRKEHSRSKRKSRRRSYSSSSSSSSSRSRSRSRRRSRRKERSRKERSSRRRSRERRHRRRRRRRYSSSSSESSSYSSSRSSSSRSRSRRRKSSRRRRRYSSSSSSSRSSYSSTSSSYSSDRDRSSTRRRSDRRRSSVNNKDIELSNDYKKESPKRDEKSNNDDPTTKITE